jgi:ATP-binding cassette subfamily A (ABC1) protein 3
MPNGVSDTICFGISFSEETSPNWAYAMHYNSSGNPGRMDIPDSIFVQEVLFKEEEASPAFSKQYFTSGALVIQNFIDNAILRISAGMIGANIQARFVRMPVAKYSDSGVFGNTNNGQIDLYIIFPLLVLYLGFIFHMLKEKEGKIRENMRNMGMAMMPHYLAWLSFYVCVLFVCSIIWLLIVKFSFFKYSNTILVWLLFFLPGLQLLTLSFIVCSFFTTSKPGVLFGIVSFFILYALTIAKATVNPPSERTYNFFALSPFAGLNMAGSSVTLLESTNNFGFGWEIFFTEINYFKYSTFFFIALGESALFFLLGTYLDQIWPSEIGIKKHPLFCFGVKKKKRIHPPATADPNYNPKNYEPLTQDLQDKLKDPKSTIQVKNLRKVYSTGKVAVHDLSLEMFDNQIFALLGHNGAGKTTTISMISGLLTQTSGSVSICGYDTETENETIKTILGVCPQLNPIFDNLTCKEHLELYATLKMGGDKEPDEKEINQILTDIDLYDKKDYVAGRLSGGQKRKLCIGIAFIGGSKVILLDEPTSGMDTYARRFLWEMIKKYKKDRIIILCTHYMDEADFLGDRFGIMGEGRLVTCGSSLFLKKRFGVGYDLTVVKADE